MNASTPHGRLRTALERREISIREFQRLMEATGIEGTSYPAVHRALQGKPVPAIDFLEGAARILDVRREWLILGAGEMTEEEQRKTTEAPEPPAMRGADVDLKNVETILKENLDFVRPLIGDHDRARAIIRFQERQSAVRRFARKLADAEWPDSPWQRLGKRRRGELYAAAARFLVGVERLFDDIGTGATVGRKMNEDEEGNYSPWFDRVSYTRDKRVPFAEDLFLGESWSRGWYVVWSDAVLDLFARRVKGLGERTGTFIDAHVPRGTEMSKPRHGKRKPARSKR